MKKAIVSLIFLFVTSLAMADAIKCTAVPAPESSGFLDFSEVGKESEKITTVVVVKKTAASIGHVFSLKKIGKMWRSIYSPDNQNHQGDPRNLIFALGERVARKFNIRMISESEMEAPDATLHNHGIAQANVYLRSKGLEEIGVGFYETSSADPAQDKIYFDNIKKDKYPVAMNGHYLVHDISLHYGSILIPKILLKHAVRKTEQLEDFFRRVRQVLAHHNPYVRQKFQEIENRVMKLHTGHMDAFNGNAILVTAERILGSAGVKAYQVDVLDHILGNTVSDFIEVAWMNQVTGVVGDLQYAEINGRPVISERDAIGLYRSLNTLGANYVKTLSKDMKEGIRYTPEELTQFIDQRIEALRGWP